MHVDLVGNPVVYVLLFLHTTREFSAVVAVGKWKSVLSFISLTMLHIAILILSSSKSSYSVGTKDLLWRVLHYKVTIKKKQTEQNFYNNIDAFG